MTSSKGSDFGNKPLIVIIGLVASIFAIVAFFSGKPEPASIASNHVVVTVFVSQPNSVPTQIPQVVIVTATNEYPVIAATNGQDNSNRSARISDEIAEVNLRRSPGYLNKNDDTDVIVKIPKGALVTIIEDSKDKDGLTWWKVSWNGYEGWIADHTGNGRTIMIFNP